MAMYNYVFTLTPSACPLRLPPLSTPSVYPLSVDHILWEHFSFRCYQHIILRCLAQALQIACAFRSYGCYNIGLQLAPSL